MIRLIAAIDQRNGIATDDGIPWQGRIPADTKYFRAQTADGTLVMGYGTYEELGQPFHNRENFVVSRSHRPELRPGFVAVADLLAFLRQHSHELVWVLGGAAVFAQSISVADELYITQLDADFHCTKFFPMFNDQFVLRSALAPDRENTISFRFEIWQRGRPAAAHP